MNKEIRTVDPQRQIVQITTIDERWYARPVQDAVTKLPSYQFVPSVTWIAESYPKGIGFYKWLANTGWDEAQALKEAAGDKGSKVHQAISQLLDGQVVKMDDAIVNPSTGQPEPLTLEEYDALRAFSLWHDRAKPISLAKDLVVWNDAAGYAGTLDYLCRMGEVVWLLDFKTSQSVWPSHEIQVAAYKHALPESLRPAKLGILQLGYRRNQDGYKLTEVADQFELFLAAKRIWAKDTAGQTPKQKDYPMQVQLTLAVDASEPTNAQEAQTGGTNGPDDRRAAADGVRESRGGRVGSGHHRGGAVRRATPIQSEK